MRLVLSCLLVLAAACGDNKKAAPDDAGGIDARPIDASSIDAPPDGAAGHVKGCLDMPGQLPGNPNGQLPCDFVPPGLQL